MAKDYLANTREELSTKGNLPRLVMAISELT